MPTPVGPLGPDEFDPNDPDLWPDLWDWDAASTPPAPWSGWVRATACVIVVVFGLLAIASFFR